MSVDTVTPARPGGAARRPPAAAPGRAETLPLRPYQREAVDAVEAAWARGVRRPAVVLPTGTGKGHPFDTEIPTPKGWRRVGDLAVGDDVYGSDGRPTRVTGLYDRGMLDTYLVTTKHGHVVEVDGDHLWQVTRKGRRPRVVTTEWLTEQPLKDGDGWMWALPVTAPVQRPAADLPLHPYVVGALIANGGMTHAGTALTTPDPHVAARVAKLVDTHQVADTTPGVCPRYSLRGLTSTTHDLGMRVRSGLKRIPVAYLLGSVEQRTDLLHGLMDGDGSQRPGGRASAYYHTTSRGLADDMVELVTSLGGTASVNVLRRQDELQVHILMPSDIPAFWTPRKAAREHPRKRFKPRSTIVDVTPHRRVPIRCLSVAADDQLYLVTRAHVVTHNTVILATLAARQTEAGQRSVILVHRDELLRQTIDKITGVAPGLDVGVIQRDRAEIDRPVVVASVPTLARDRRLRAIPPGTFDTVIVDEAHHAAAPAWRRALDHFDAAYVVGLSATLWRETGGLGDVWDEIVYRADILPMIRAGYLVDAIGQRVTVDGLDLGRVRSSAGDLVDGDLGHELLRADVPQAVLGAYREHAMRPDGRPRPGISFAPTVEVAEAITETLCAGGIRAETIVGSTPIDTRQRAYRAVRDGELDVLSSVSVLTEGFDLPEVEVVVNCRPTRSAGLYVQRGARARRAAPGARTTQALVLDISGASTRHQLATLATLTTTDGGLVDTDTIGAARRNPTEPMSLAELAPMDPIVGDGVPIDLFAVSASAWGRTPGGVWHISTRTGLVALWPAWDVDRDHWRVVHLPDQWSLHHAYPAIDGHAWSLPLAMSWAERFAAELDFTVASRRSTWRSRRPSDATIRLAQRLGIATETEDGRVRRAGDVSRDIGCTLAGRLLDPKLAAYYAARRPVSDPPETVTTDHPEEP